MMTRNDIDFALTAANLAMSGAADYLSQHKLTVVDWDAATSTLRDGCKATVAEALADARCAIDASMGDIAAATFKATMRLTGINVAKEWLAAGIAK
jgi:hypothetical protein